MKENEEKNSGCNKDLRTKEKNNNGLHYKKIEIKSTKKDSNNNNADKEDLEISDQIKKLQNNNNNQNLNKKEIIKDDKNFMLEDINNQLDEILENIENDGIEEINKQIRFLNEDKNMFNTISYNDNISEKDLIFKKIDNTNKFSHKRNNKYNNTHINNNKYFNQHNKHYINDNRNLTNNKYLFTSLNNTYRNWKEEDNCNNDEGDKYLNKTNISLFYKYNSIYNSKKGDKE